MKNENALLNFTIKNIKPTSMGAFNKLNRNLEKYANNKYYLFVLSLCVRVFKNSI
jgi:hypothetical protein